MEIKIVKVLFFFGHLDVRVLKGGCENEFWTEKTLYFSFSNGSLNSLLGLGFMFLLYGMNIQCLFLRFYQQHI